MNARVQQRRAELANARVWRRRAELMELAAVAALLGGVAGMLEQLGRRKRIGRRQVEAAAQRLAVASVWLEQGGSWLRAGRGWARG